MKAGISKSEYEDFEKLRGPRTNPGRMAFSTLRDPSAFRHRSSMSTQNIHSSDAGLLAVAKGDSRDTNRTPSQTFCGPSTASNEHARSSLSADATDPHYDANPRRASLGEIRALSTCHTARRAHTQAHMQSRNMDTKVVRGSSAVTGGSRAWATACGPRA